MSNKALVLISLVFVAAIVEARLVVWGSSVYEGAALTVDGVVLQDDWLVYMYQDVNGDNGAVSTWENELMLTADGIVSSSSGVTANDQLLDLLTYGTESAFVVEGVGLKIAEKPVMVNDDINVYTIVFDATTVGAAQNFIIADANTFDVGSDPFGFPVEYNVSSINGSWQAVPEPAVASLIAIFGGGLLVSRRIFSKG